MLGLTAGGSGALVTVDCRGRTHSGDTQRAASRRRTGGRAGRLRRVRRRPDRARRGRRPPAGRGARRQRSRPRRSGPARRRRHRRRESRHRPLRSRRRVSRRQILAGQREPRDTTRSSGSAQTRCVVPASCPATSWHRSKAAERRSPCTARRPAAQARSRRLPPGRTRRARSASRRDAHRSAGATTVTSR